MELMYGFINELLDLDRYCEMYKSYTRNNMFRLFFRPSVVKECHTSYVMFHMSTFTGHITNETCNTLQLTRHISLGGQEDCQLEPQVSGIIA